MQVVSGVVAEGKDGQTAFWASKKGKDFSFLGPILFTSLVILLVTSFMQVLFLSLTHTHTHNASF